MFSVRIQLSFILSYPTAVCINTSPVLCSAMRSTRFNNAVMETKNKQFILNIAKNNIPAMHEILKEIKLGRIWNKSDTNTLC